MQGTSSTKIVNSEQQQPSQDVPIFLRKTYHMIDTCDPTIACWSEDGETFVVKDPVKFERTIIPQFFKHSKFSSFVRQLNFYSFRKIKYNDTIRIDPVKEKETANFWRFRHEKFRRGQPAMLSDIKRMNGAKDKAGVDSKGKKNSSVSVEESKTIKTEVQTLKLRIEEMTKNIDQLTAMVQKVSVSQDDPQAAVVDRIDHFVGTKRKKTTGPDDIIRPDEMLSSMDAVDLEDMALDPVVSANAILPPMPVPSAMPRETSVETVVSDNEFVDELFNAFHEESSPGQEIFAMESPILPPLEATQPEPISKKSNRADPKLMKKLSEALELLPKDIQEMIVNRLVHVITSDAGLHKNASAVAALSQVTNVTKASAVQSSSIKSNAPSAVPLSPPNNETATLPLAAATLAALLHHYGSATNTSNCKSDKSSPAQKSIPVIPVHA